MEWVGGCLGRRGMRLLGKVPVLLFRSPVLCFELSVFYGFVYTGWAVHRKAQHEMHTGQLRPQSMGRTCRHYAPRLYNQCTRCL